MPDFLNVRLLLAYALPAFVVALPTIPVFIQIPALYGVQLGLGLATTGYVLLAARLFDTVSDPLVGLLCDRWTIFGLRRKPWIVGGAVIAGLGLYKILNPAAGVASGYLLIWSLVLYAGWTMVAVPYLAWGAELSSDYNQRTRITAWREAFGLLGIIGAGILGSVTASLGWSESDSIGAIAWAAIALGIIVMPMLLHIVPERANSPNQVLPATDRHLADDLCALANNKPFLRLLFAWFLNGVANGIPAALFFIYLEYGLGAASDIRPLFVLAYFVTAIVSVPFWFRLSTRFGKHRAWCFGMIAACLAFVSVPWISPGGFIPFAVVCVITGAALGADLVLPPALQADVTDYADYRSGHAQTGLQFALWGMSTKLALAGAVGLALPGLEYAGFDPEVPSDDARIALLVIYALIPVVVKTMAVLLIWRFPLSAPVQLAIRRRLARRDRDSVGIRRAHNAHKAQRNRLRLSHSERMHEYETN